MQKLTFLLLTCLALSLGCNSSTVQPVESTQPSSTTPGLGQSGVKDDISNPNIVQVAVGSKDHTTLVTALPAASLVDAMSTAGPFTVFAPTNAAFDKLPTGTVVGL